MRHARFFRKILTLVFLLTLSLALCACGRGGEATAAPSAGGPPSSDSTPLGAPPSGSASPSELPTGSASPAESAAPSAAPDAPPDTSVGSPAPSNAPAPTPTSTPAPAASAAIDFSPTVDGFTFSLSPAQLLDLLARKNLILVMPDYSNLPQHIENPTKDGRQYNGTNDDFTYKTENGLAFTYSSDGKLKAIAVSGADIPTAEGLKVGDSVAAMERIYGGGYKKDVEGYNVFQYYNGSADIYLNIYYSGDVITSYALRTFSSINTD